MHITFRPEKPYTIDEIKSLIKILLNKKNGETLKILNRSDIDQKKCILSEFYLKPSQVLELLLDFATEIQVNSENKKLKKYYFTEGSLIKLEKLLNLAIKQKLEKIKEQGLKELEIVSDEASADTFRIKYIGKNGLLTEAMKGLKDLAPEERPVVGKLVNEIKNIFNEKITSYLSKESKIKKINIFSIRNFSVTGNFFGPGFNSSFISKIFRCNTNNSNS